jgi:hypothetical protein
MQQYVIKFVSDLRHVVGFLHHHDTSPTTMHTITTTPWWILIFPQERFQQIATKFIFSIKSQQYINFMHISRNIKSQIILIETSI